MIRSMTAFAAGDASVTQGRLNWELRSVNQRYLDLSIRLPEALRGLEPAVREILRARLGRGKVEATLRFFPDPAATGQRLSLNRPLAEALLRCHRELAEQAGTRTQPDLGALLRWPEVITEQALDIEDLNPAAHALLESTVADLIAGREREGASLATIMNDRLERVEALAAQIRDWLPDIRAGLQTRFAERLAGLSQPLDPGRLEQEVALQLQKLDIDEELDRLDTHCTEVRRVMDSDEPVGRRLDFFMQELNREANTLGSKATDPRLSQAAVDLKVWIEQMREQVQNIE